MKPSIRIQTEDFDLGAEYQLLRQLDAAVGAVVTFTGLVRDLEKDSSINSLTLQHYPGMTESLLQDIVDQAAARWDLIGLTVIHRVGKLLPSDQIVFVGVASQHRADAFEAAQFVMDYLKTRRPFGKKSNRMASSIGSRAKIRIRRPVSVGLMMINVDGVILAAGKSSRMGRANKVLANLGGRSLLEIAVEKLGPQVDTLVINGDPALCGEQALADRVEGFQGPLMGLYTALLSEQLSRADYLMMVPCDGPFLPDNLVAELYQQIVQADADIACVRYQGFAQPTFSLWHKRVLPDIEQALIGGKKWWL